MVSRNAAKDAPATVFSSLLPSGDCLTPRPSRTMIDRETKGAAPMISQGSHGPHHGSVIAV
jgi:hypothetical protein